MELIASKMNEEEMREYLKVEALMFQDIDGLREAILRKGSHNAKRLSMPYFDGDYITKDIDMTKFKKIDPKTFSTHNIPVNYDKIEE
jgi:glutamine phosphoribosylpyrophosphate amidotransferase